MEAQICWEMAAEKEGVERVCCHCVMAFVAENYAICLSEVFFFVLLEAYQIAFKPHNTGLHGSDDVGPIPSSRNTHFCF